MSDEVKKYALLWFASDDWNDKLVGEVELQLSPADVRRWFSLSDGDPAHLVGECLSVASSEKRHLQPLVEVNIDLNEYDYFIEGRE